MISCYGYYLLPEIVSTHASSRLFLNGFRRISIGMPYIKDIHSVTDDDVDSNGNDPYNDVTCVGEDIESNCVGDHDDVMTIERPVVTHERVRMWINDVWEEYRRNDALTRPSHSIHHDDVTPDALVPFQHPPAVRSQDDTTRNVTNDITSFVENDRCALTLYDDDDTVNESSAMLPAYVTPNVTSTAVTALAFFVDILRNRHTPPSIYLQKTLPKLTCAKNLPTSHLISPFKRHFLSKVRQPFRRPRSHVTCRGQGQLVNKVTCCNNDKNDVTKNSGFKRNSSHVNCRQTSDVSVPMRRVQSWTASASCQHDSKPETLVSSRDKSNLDGFIKNV